MEEEAIPSLPLEEAKKPAKRGRPRKVPAPEGEAVAKAPAKRGRKPKAGLEPASAEAPAS